MTNSHDKASFDLVNKEIDRLFARLEAKGVCPCCAATGLLYRGAYLYQATVGSAETKALFDDVAGTLDENDETVPDRSLQH